MVIYLIILLFKDYLNFINYKMKKIILICGLIRKESIFKNNLDIYIRLKNEKIIDDIIVCTENNILDLNLVNYLISYDVKIFNHEPLPIEEIIKIDPQVHSRPLCKVRNKNIYISIWREVYNFMQGLLQIPEESFIMKTRTDLFLSYNLLKKIFNNYIIKLDENNIFEYKIWAGGFHYCEPMHFSDYAFFGYKDDLLKTISLNGDFLRWNNKLKPLNTSDIIWWWSFFNSYYPIIKEYAEKCIGIYEHHTLVENNTFYKAIATNILIIDKYFIIDSGIDEYILYPTWGGSQIKNSYSSFQQYPISQNSEWINKFKNGEFNSNKIMNQIYIEYQKILN